MILLLEILGLWILAGVLTIAILNDVKRWVANR
jgi:hypothetical protein